MKKTVVRIRYGFPELKIRTSKIHSPIYRISVWRFKYLIEAELVTRGRRISVQINFVPQRGALTGR